MCGMAAPLIIIAAGAAIDFCTASVGDSHLFDWWQGSGQVCMVHAGRRNAGVGLPTPCAQLLGCLCLCGRSDPTQSVHGHTELCHVACLLSESNLN
jgi:hypothetical protein